MGYVVRAMNVDDIAQVSAIDREAFPTEWPPPSFKRELGSSMISYLVAIDKSRNAIEEAKTSGAGSRSIWGVLASRASRFLGKREIAAAEPLKNSELVVGYASIWIMVDESHLTSIAVRKGHRNQGVGELLLISVMKLSLQKRARVVTLEVRVSNHGAQALYAKYGFNAVGMRRRYYTDNGEDAVIMTTDNITSPSFQTKMRELEATYLEKHKALATEG